MGPRKATTKQAPRWGVYVRMSQAKVDKDGRKVDDLASVHVQREQALAFCKREGIDPETVVWYVDNDRSAWKKKKVPVTDTEGRKYEGYRVERPHWSQALADLRNGAIQTLGVTNLDRLARDPRDLEDAIEVVEHYAPARVVSLTGGDVDLTTDNGRMSARFLVAMAQKSSADTARRVRDKHLSNAQSGKPVGGTRPFGWKADKRTPDLVESTLIWQAAQELLEGLGTNTIARQWNEVGVTTSRGRQWSGQLVRQVLLSPRVAGWRIHQERVAVGTDGQQVRGQWAPILSDAEHDAVVAALVHPETRQRVPRRNARHYLLTGTARCGVCNRPLYGNASGHKPGAAYYYQCSGFGHSVAASGTALDHLVTRLVLDRLAAEQLHEPVVAEFEGEERLAVVVAKIEELMAAYRGDVLPADVVFPQVKELGAERDRLLDEQRAIASVVALPAVSSMDRGAWEDMDTERQRGVVERLLDAVLVAPATKRGNTFDVSRVSVVWRTA